MTILAGLLLYLFLSRRQRPNGSFRFNDELGRVLAASLLLLGLGISSVYLTENREIESYENKPVFGSLREKINDVSKITFQNNNASLEFYLNDGLWKLRGHETFPVYQERIRSFLSALLEAVYYEKKSDRGEDLEKFGLAPLGVADSPNIRIELKNADGQNLTAFNVGRYDLDIGRGAKAAYIKFDNRFQVWLIAADFIDLEPTWQNWTYSSLWNLRFGRLAAVDGKTDTDLLADLARTMLNTYFIGSIPQSKQAEKAFAFLLNVENNNKLTVSFYKLKNKYYVAYDFISTINGKHLQTFADSTKNKFFEITAEDMEKVQNVLKSGRKPKA